MKGLNMKVLLNPYVFSQYEKNVFKSPIYQKSRQKCTRNTLLRLCLFEKQSLESRIILCQDKRFIKLPFPML